MMKPRAELGCTIFLLGLAAASPSAWAAEAKAEGDELFGDTLNRTVTWNDRADVSTLAGQPIRIRMALSDADLYSLKFEE